MGYVSPGRAVISGVASAPGIPLSLSPLSGLYQLPGGAGVGISLSGNSFFSEDVNHFSFGNTGAVNGVISPVSGSPFSTGGATLLLAFDVDPAGMFLYVSNPYDLAGNGFGVYSINQVTGKLTVTPGSPYTPGTGSSYSTKVRPDGNFVVSGNNSSIMVWSVNRSTGSLTPAPGSPVAFAGTANSLAFNAGGNLLFALSVATGFIHVYQFSTSGVLTEIVGSPFAASSTATVLSIDAANNVLYAAGGINNLINAYSINTTNSPGQLTAIPGSPFAVTGNVYALKYSNNFLYAGDNSGSLHIYASNNGVLSHVSDQVIAANIIARLEIDSSNSILYAAIDGGSIAAFNVNNGVLSAVTGSPFALGTDATIYAMALSPFNNLLFVGGSNGLMSVGSTSSVANAPLMAGYFDPVSAGNGYLNINGILYLGGTVVLNETIADARYAQIAGNIAQNFAVKLLTTDHAAGGIAGTPTNDNAVAGSVGEYIESTVAAGAAVALTTGVVANVTSIALTAGDWDIEGVVNYHSSGTTNVNDATAGVSSVSATQGGVGTYITDYLTIVIPAAPDPVYAAPKTRISLAATATIYLIAMSHFTVSTLSAYGHISARRVR